MICRTGPTQRRKTKKTPHISVQCLRSGGEYRDRTGDLLHAMQALSRTTRLHTPHKAVGIDDDLRCNGKKPRLQKMYGKTFTACINIYTDINNKQPMETMSCLLPIEMFQQMMMKEKK